MLYNYLLNKRIEVQIKENNDKKKKWNALHHYLLYTQKFITAPKE